MTTQRDLASRLLRLQDQELSRLQGLLAAAVELAEALAETSSAGSAHRGLCHVAREAEDVLGAVVNRVTEVRRALAPLLEREAPPAEEAGAG